MIDLETARQLLDFGARIGEGVRAEDQLKGAVAVHNLLQARRVAYLADEVGMGKTYVALGALALFRHFNPDFRVLVIAPRGNIQTKWMKELRNFVAHNVRFPDLRVKSLNGRSARPLVACENLLNLIHEVAIDRDRDFFTRLTSFSLPVVGRDAVDPTAGHRLRDGLRRYLPWMRDEVFDLRNKQAFKDNFARALCCSLPPFDLVIVDESHNLKHGFGENVSSRNRVLGLAMGHADSATDRKLFPGFGPRAQRVLFLSATPVEETYRQLWNLQGQFDYLFVDEAGQFSLANTIAAALSASNLVLIGDQMQLAQPTLGVHPGDSGRSALDYLLDGVATIPPDLGIFLDTTWRMHPDVCEFISAAIYERRLTPHPGTIQQRIWRNDSKTSRISKDNGILFLAVPHQGNSQYSEEEAIVIEKIAKQLLGLKVSDRGKTNPRPLMWDDILFVAPFNMQVRRLQQRLGPQARIGSVDKFQGQEAHVVILSMCSSSLDDSPRGADFLLNPNRMNVAISRAKTLALVVGCRDIMAARCRSISDMDLVNLYCWLGTYADLDEQIESPSA